MEKNIRNVFKNVRDDLGINIDIDIEARKSSTPIKKSSTLIVEPEKSSTSTKKSKRTKTISKKRPMGFLDSSRSKKNSLSFVLEVSTRSEQGISVPRPKYSKPCLNSYKGI